MLDAGPPTRDGGRSAARRRVDPPHAPNQDAAGFPPVISLAGAGESTGPPQIDPAALMRLYTSGRHRELSQALHDVLRHYNNHTYTAMNEALQERINTLVECLLFFMTKPGFQIANELVVPILNMHHTIGNLVELSAFQNTDPQVQIVGRQKDNLVRLLLLYSARNTVQITPKVFFDANPRLASLWYLMYPLCSGAISATRYEKARRHLRQVDDRLEVDERATHIYFSSTYLDPQGDRIVKSAINASIRRQVGDHPLHGRARPDHLAVVTSKWWPQSAVYKSSFPLVRGLADRYRMTLVHLGEVVPPLDESLFAEVRHVRCRDGGLDARSVVDNDFQMAYFPDVGMTPESIWLANTRVAPIQAMGYGHPVSTFGSRIDYFIGGADAEVAALAEQNYSERLVLIPGIGAHPTYPNYQRRGVAPPADHALVNCSWGSSKINPPMLANLREIQRRAGRPVRFHFFPNWGLERYNSLVPMLQGLGRMFGDTVTVVGDSDYPNYMRRMEEAHLSVDSYPFGGYNTIVDSLYLGKPIVTYEGTKFYNRAASALLRKLGLEELIARGDDEYVEKTVRLIADDDYRQGLTERLEQMDLRARIFDTDEPRYFAKAIDFLIENHDALAADGSHAPIFIR